MKTLWALVFAIGYLSLFGNVRAQTGASSNLFSTKSGRCLANSGEFSRILRIGSSGVVLLYRSGASIDSASEFGVGFRMLRWEIHEALGSEGDVKYVLHGLNCDEELLWNPSLEAYQTRFGRLRVDRLDSSSFRIRLNSGAHWILERKAGRYVPSRFVSSSGIFFTEYHYGESEHLELVEIGKRVLDPSSVPVKSIRILYEKNGLMSEVRILGTTGVLVNRHRFSYVSDTIDGKEVYFLSRVTEIGAGDSPLPSLTLKYHQKDKGSFFGLLTEIKTPLGGNTIFRYDEKSLEGGEKVRVFKGSSRLGESGVVNDLEVSFGGGTAEGGFDWVETKDFAGATSRVTYHTDPTDLRVGLPRETRVLGTEAEAPLSESYLRYDLANNQVWLDRMVFKRGASGQERFRAVDFDYDADKDRLDEIISYSDVSYNAGTKEIEDLDSQDTQRAEWGYLDSHGLARNLISSRQIYLGGELSRSIRTSFEHSVFPFPTKTELEVDAGSLLGEKLVGTIVYDDMTGRPFQVFSPSGIMTHFNYDEFGRAVSQIKGPLVTTELIETNWIYHRETGFLSRVHHPNGNILTYLYDDHQRLVGVDAAPFGMEETHTASIEYDDVQRLITLHSGPVNDVRTSYRAFDEWGQLVQATHKEDDGSLLATRLEWDEMGRLSERSFPPAPAASSLPSSDFSSLNAVQYEFDSLSRLTEISAKSYENEGMSNGLAPVNWDLSQLDEVSYETSGVASRLTQNLSTIEMGWGDADLGEELTNQFLLKDGGKTAEWIDPAGSSYAVKTDSLGRIKSSNLPGRAPISEVQYEKEHLKKITLPGGNTAEVIARDLVGRPLVKRFERSGRPTEELHYYWDAGGFSDAQVPPGELGSLEKYIANENDGLELVDRVAYSYEGPWISRIVHTVGEETAEIHYFRNPKTFEVERILFYHPSMGPVEVRYIRDALGRQKEVRYSTGGDPGSDSSSETTIAVVEERNEVGLIKNLLFSQKDLRHIVDYSDAGVKSIRYSKADGTPKHSYAVEYHAGSSLPSKEVITSESGLVEMRTYDEYNSRGQPKNWSQVFPLKTYQHQPEYDAHGNFKKDQGVKIHETKYEHSGDPYLLTEMEVTLESPGGATQNKTLQQIYDSNRSISHITSQEGSVDYSYSASNQVVRVENPLGQEEVNLTYGALGRVVRIEAQDGSGLSSSETRFGLRDIIAKGPCEFVVRIAIETPPRRSGATTGYYELNINPCQTLALHSNEPGYRGPLAALPEDPAPGGGGGGGAGPTRPRRPGGPGPGPGGPPPPGPAVCPDGTIPVLDDQGNLVKDAQGNPVCKPWDGLTVVEFVSYVLGDVQGPPPEEPDPLVDIDPKNHWEMSKEYVFEPIGWTLEENDDPCRDVQVGVLRKFNGPGEDDFKEYEIWVNPNENDGFPFIVTDTGYRGFTLVDMLDERFVPNLSERTLGTTTSEGGWQGVGSSYENNRGKNMLFAEEIPIWNDDHTASWDGVRIETWYEGDRNMAFDQLKSTGATSMNVALATSWPGMKETARVCGEFATYAGRGIASSCSTAANRIGLTKRTNQFMAQITRAYTDQERRDAVKAWFLSLSRREQNEAIRALRALNDPDSGYVLAQTLGASEAEKLSALVDDLMCLGATQDDIFYVGHLTDDKFLYFARAGIVIDAKPTGAHHPFTHAYQTWAMAREIGLQRTFNLTGKMDLATWNSFHETMGGGTARSFSTVSAVLQGL